MLRLDTLEKKVRELYEARNPNRAEWANWLYSNHVFVVAENAGAFCRRFGGDPELAMAAGMLHDIADTVMERENPNHEAESVKIAIRLLNEAGYTDDDKKIIVDDAIRFHGCHGADTPRTPEGKAMASADGCAHLATKFYDYAVEASKPSMTDEEIRQWALPKLDRDFKAKIFYDEVREDVRSRYEQLKEKFSILGQV